MHDHLHRPVYTRDVLAALAECDGISDWLFLPNVEPGHEDVIDAFRQWTACESRLAVNKERLGQNRNTQETLVRALLLRAAVIVHLEDDTVPSPDALRYFDWAVREILIPDVKSEDEHQITLVSGYNKPKSQPRPDQTHQCDTRPIWTPWGWGMDRSRLAWLLANWCTGIRSASRARSRPSTALRAASCSPCSAASRTSATIWARGDPAGDAAMDGRAYEYHRGGPLIARRSSMATGTPHP